MVRTQIQLTERQHRDLRHWARSLGISLSEAVRRCVGDRLAAEAAAPDRALLVREARAVYGKYRDSRGDSRVALDHDDHLPEAYGE